VKGTGINMKITILDKAPEEENEIILKCDALDDNIINLINMLKCEKAKLPVYMEGEITLLDYSEIFYFEAVDQKVFAYTKSEVYEVKKRLYELLEILPPGDFIRISKPVIVNLRKIKRLSPALGGRYEALLINGERVIISRQYVSDFKERLGL